MSREFGDKRALRMSPVVFESAGPKRAGCECEKYKSFMTLYDEQEQPNPTGWRLK